MQVMDNPGQQFVAITFFHYLKGKKWWAFSQMRRGPAVLAQQDGMVFSKLMGSGRGAGFSFWPDFSTYAILTVLKNPASFIKLTQSSFWTENAKNSDDKFTVILRPLQVKGTWNDRHPFKASTEVSNTPVRAAITRASIRFSRLVSFWKQVPATSRAIESAGGRIFSAGIGEWPWIEQATFSLWESEKALKDYAYRNKAHQSAINKTHQLKWYKEELFARFEPVATIGMWKGNKLLEKYGIKWFSDVPPLTELQALSTV